MYLHFIGQKTRLKTVSCSRPRRYYVDLNPGLMEASYAELMPTRVLGLPQSIEIDKRPDKKFRQGFTGAPAPQAGAQAGSLYGVRVGMCPRVRPEGWLRCFAHPLGGAGCRGHAQYPAFAPSSSEVAVGVFLVFLYLFVQNLPQLHMHAIIFSPL